MALLNNLFDILRGFPKEGAIDETFPIHLTSGVPDALLPGLIVTMQSDGTMALATTPNRSAANALPVWVVIEGGDYDNTFLTKVVCLRSNAMLRLDPTNFAAGAYVYGTPLSFTAGQWKLAATNDQIIGEVLLDNRAVDGTMNVFYTGGHGAML